MAESGSLTVYPSSFSSDAGTISTVGTGAVGLGSDNTSESNMTRISVGKSTSTNFYVNFDLSAIPEGAEINSVSCKVRSKLAYSFYRATAALYSGGTAKTGTVNVNSTASTVYEISGGAWTRDEILSCQLVFDLYISSSTSSYRWAYIYGADLTVVYTYENQRFMLRLGGDGVELPEGYTRLEYIESTGSQYIDTGLKPDENTRIVLIAQPMEEPAVTEYRAFFGVRANNTYFEIIKADGSSLRVYALWSTTVDQNATFLIDWAKRTVFDLGCGVARIDDETYTISGSDFQSEYPVFLCATNNGGTAAYHTKMRVFAAYGYQNGSVVRECFPAKSASGVAGMHDVKNSVFYPSATSTPFVAGPEYNDVWHDISRTFKKVSGIWVEQTELANVVDQTKRLVNGGEIN